MLSVFNNPSQSSLWIVWWKVSQEGIYMYYLYFLSIDMETKKQAENLLILDARIPKACKKWSRNRKSQVFKKLFYWLMNFMIINIERFAGINFVIAIIFTSSFIMQIVNILELLFWNLCVLDKLRHCFLTLKGHLKLIKN